MPQRLVVAIFFTFFVEKVLKNNCVRVKIDI